MQRYVFLYIGANSYNANFLKENVKISGAAFIAKTAPVKVSNVSTLVSRSGWRRLSIRHA